MPFADILDQSHPHYVEICQYMHHLRGERYALVYLVDKLISIGPSSGTPKTRLDGTVIHDPQPAATHGIKLTMYRQRIKKITEQLEILEG